MATTETPIGIRKVAEAHGGGPGNAGSLPERYVQPRGPATSTTGIWVALASIAMIFAALTSALIVREGSANDWLHIDLPWLVYFNTAILVVSSVTLEAGKRKIASSTQGERTMAGAWLWATLVLGLVFVTGQWFVWRSLKAQGLYLATNPTSSFFYVLTAVHAVHVIGGLGGLLRVIAKFHRGIGSLGISTVSSTSYYWHFMGMLWGYLLFIITTRM